MPEEKISIDYESKYQEMQEKYCRLQEEYKKFKENIENNYISIQQTPINFASNLIDSARWDPRREVLEEIAEHLLVSVKHARKNNGIF